MQLRRPLSFSLKWIIVISAGRGEPSSHCGQVPAVCLRTSTPRLPGLVLSTWKTRSRLGRTPWNIGIECRAHGWRLVAVVTLVSFGRNMKGSGTSWVNGTGTGKRGCPTGTHMKGNTSTVKGMARSELVTWVGAPPDLILY